MAPRKKAEDTRTTASEKPATRRSTRMTRSSAKRLNAKLTELPTESGKKRKQEKAAESKKKKVKTEVKEELANKTASSSEAQLESNKELKEEEPEVDDDDEENENENEAKEEDDKEESPTVDAVTKTIVIEHCKQCNAFKTRAMQVKDGLSSAFPSISVLLNPEKPRRGCFEIREEGGEKFISLLNMKRPFPPLKALDMDQVISDIIDKVKSSTKASG